MFHCPVFAIIIMYSISFSLCVIFLFCTYVFVFYLPRNKNYLLDGENFQFSFHRFMFF